MRFSKTSFIVPVLSLGLIAPAAAIAQDFGREQYRFEDRRYEGRSFERLRELAHVLDHGQAGEAYNVCAGQLRANREVRGT